MIANDNRRAVVAAAEGDARNIELEARMIIEMIAGPLACGFAGGTVFFQFRGGTNNPTESAKPRA
jgi:hypothetical protein